MPWPAQPRPQVRAVPARPTQTGSAGTNASGPRSARAAQYGRSGPLPPRRWLASSKVTALGSERCSSEYARQAPSLRPDDRSQRRGATPPPGPVRGCIRRLDRAPGSRQSMRYARARLPPQNGPASHVPGICLSTAPDRAAPRNIGDWRVNLTERLLPNVSSVELQEAVTDRLSPTWLTMAKPLPSLTPRKADALHLHTGAEARTVDVPAGRSALIGGRGADA